MEEGGGGVARRQTAVFDRSRRGFTGEIFTHVTTGGDVVHDVLLDTGSSPLALPYVTCTSCVQLHARSRRRETPALQLYQPSDASETMVCPVREPTALMGIIRVPSSWAAEQESEQATWWDLLLGHGQGAGDDDGARTLKQEQREDEGTQQCTSDVSFVDGSGYEALLFRELVGIGELTAENVTVEAITRWNANMPLGGILGLAPHLGHRDAREDSSPLLNVLVETGAITQDAFTICLANDTADGGGALTLGVPPPALAADPAMQRVPYDDSFGLYEVTLSGIKLGQSTVYAAEADPNGPAWSPPDAPPAVIVGVIDTGSNSIVLPENVMTAFRSAFRSEVCGDGATSTSVGRFVCASEANFDSLMDGYVVSGISKDDGGLPDLVFELAGSEGGELRVPAQSYLVDMPDTSEPSIALSIVVIPAATRAMAIFGAPLLENYATVFDRGAKQLGFLWHPTCHEP